MAKLFANSGDPDQTPHSAASDLRLHCLIITLLRVSRLQWVKTKRLWAVAYLQKCIKYIWKINGSQQLLDRFDSILTQM